MAYDLGEIGAVVTLNDKPYVDTINGIKKKSEQTFSSIAKMAAGLFGLNQIRSFLQDSVRAFIKQEDAVNGLNRALNRIGEGRASKRLQQFAKEMQSVTTFGDEATLAVMKMGLNMGISAKQMEDATRAAMGLAAGYDNLSIETAMQLVAKAANGNTARLKMYGITLNEAGTKQEKFNELLKKGNDLFQLSTAETFGQRLIQLGNAWGDMKEQIGDFFLQLTGFYDSVDDMKAQIEDFTKNFAENLDYWAFYIRYFSALAKNGAKLIIATVEPVFNYISDLGTDMFTNLVTLVGWFRDNWNSIWENIPTVVLGVVEDVVNLFANGFKSIYDLVVNWNKAWWGVITGEGFSGFETMLDGIVADLKKTVSEIGTGTGNALKSVGIPLPELQQTASMKKIIADYENLPEKSHELYLQLERDIMKAQSGTFNNLERKRDQNYGNGKGRDPVEEASAKNDVAGSFSAAVLSAMIGANSPEKETAKNTRQMVEQQKETNQKLETGAVYA